MLNKKLPKISIVTTNYNGGHFLEDTILSVINQNYPNIEYIIIDGGSTDESLDIILKYENFISYWVSEPDSGMYDAIQKGFDHSTGEIMAWLNSDDKYTIDAFSIVQEIFESFPQIEWLTATSGITWDIAGRAVNVDYRPGFNKNSFVKGQNLTGGRWFSTYFIQQEVTFWKRSLWEKSGSKLNTNLKFAGDFNLWFNFYKYTELYSVSTIIGGMRSHNNQLSVLNYNCYMKEALNVLNSNGCYTYNFFETMLRKFFFLIFNRIFIPKSRLPKYLYSIIYSVNIFYPTKRISWRNNRWELIEGLTL